MRQSPRPSRPWSRPRVGGGFWKCCDRLRLDGRPWNHKRLWRVYCQLRLNLPRWTKKRLPVRLRQPLVVVRPCILFPFPQRCLLSFSGAR
ncbi:hypothetical protein NSND_30010 [Nitrospira sp. ND1]|nr:hypothetical protein NSND_30010 [Nitrospira sp. ND1]